MIYIKRKFEGESILRIVSFLHIYFVPFTKVEESFNLQATHDILFHTFQLDQYDHIEFPGVVPRTFIGPLILSFFSAMPVWISQYFNCRKFIAQIIVRIILSEFTIYTLKKLRCTITKQFGYQTGIWFLLVTSTQFHFIFYMSRTLPNIFALPGAILSYNYWLAGSHKKFIFMSALTSIIFRMELCLLFGIFLLIDLSTRKLSIWRAIKYSIISGFFSIIMTVIIDSYFWQRTLWPEGEVLWFNTILNQSHKWGTEPFFWYFYSAIPRILLTSSLLLPFMNTKQIIPPIIFIFLLSNLPHKELRFIIYTIPIFNICIAKIYNFIWIKRDDNFLNKLLAVGLILQIILNLILSIGLLIISNKNYPGGNGLNQLNDISDRKNENIYLHIDNYAAQTGVSRFLENDNWRYNKTENLKMDELLKFTHLMIGDLENLFIYLQTHFILLSIDGFAGIEWNFDKFPPIRIKFEEKLVILKRRV